MKDKKLTYSVNVPVELANIINLARKHLMDTGYKPAGSIIFISDVFTWGIRLIAEKLKIDISNGLNLEFVNAAKLVVDKKSSSVEMDLCRILSSMDFSILEEYRNEGSEDKGIDVFDFCTQKGIDWKKLLRDDRTNKP